MMRETIAHLKQRGDLLPTSGSLWSAVLKGDGLETPLIASFDSKEVQACFQIAERSVRQNIVSFYGRVPAIDGMQ